ncbi:hypothetical protein E2986_10635 [Frieseomelitta varia]|uniref:Uncharacterized protein n=1 Tax=Frieseomelitta varia TaxID=561572 RepID=A0A833S0J3_9HYME|nr:hypothetical protein E2986_10635 [Frieseomelitta varia]
MIEMLRRWTISRDDLQHLLIRLSCRDSWYLFHLARSLDQFDCSSYATSSSLFLQSPLVSQLR